MLLASKSGCGSFSTASSPFLTHIVQDLLTLSRFDSGRDDLKLARFSFEAAVQDLYNAVYMEAQRHSHTLELELEDGLPEVTADRERTVQVMMNIVSNSIKYTPDGGKIVISAGRTGDRVWTAPLTPTGSAACSLKIGKSSCGRSLRSEWRRMPAARWIRFGR